MLSANGSLGKLELFEAKFSELHSVGRVAGGEGLCGERVVWGLYGYAIVLGQVKVVVSEDESDEDAHGDDYNDSQGVQEFLIRVLDLESQ